MHKKILLASVITATLAGCNDAHDGAPSTGVSNKAPAVNNIPSLTVGVNQDFTFQVDASDEQTLSYALDGNPSWIIIDAKSGIISVDANQSVIGDYSFDVVVSDGSLETRQLITLSVTDELPDFGNQAPVITEIPTLTARTYYPLSYRVKASDPNGDFLSFSLVDQPSWVNIDPETGVLSVDAQGGHEGNYQFLVKVHDGQTEAQTSIDLTVVAADKPVVNPSNNIPVVLDIPVLQAKSEQKSSYRINANDADGDILTFSLQESVDWVKVNPESGLIIAQPTTNEVGSHTFNVVITDGHIDVVKSFDVNVALPMTPVDPDAVQVAPFVYDIPALIAKTNGELTYRVKASDKNNDVLSFNLVGAPTWVMINPLSGLIKAKPLDGHVGTHTFDVEVTDGVFTVIKPVNLDVQLAVVEDNRTAPVVDAIPSLNVKANTMLSQRVIASDADGDTLSYSIAEQVSWLSIDPTVGLIVAQPEPAHVGSHTFTLTVSDGVFDTVQSFNVVVAEADAPTIVNTPPVIEAIADQTATEKVLSSYRVKASDKDGDVLTYSLTQSRSWMAIEPRTGLITFNPADGTEGRYRVIVAVNDGEDEVNQSFMLEVKPAPVSNVPPVLTAIADIPASSGLLTTYRLEASDADGDTLAYSLEANPEWISIDQVGLISIAPPTEIDGEHTFVVVVSDGIATTKQTVTTVVTAITEPDGPDILPVIYNATLTAAGKIISGQVECNGEIMVGGKFKVSEEDSFSCFLGHVELGTFSPRPHADTSEDRPLEADMTFDLVDLHGANVTRVLQAVNGCASVEEICLQSLSAFDLETIFTQLGDNDAVDAFLAAMAETATNDTNKAPSSHEDDTVVPAVSGGSNDLNSGFVSSNAEETLSYKPSQESKVLTIGTLTDLNQKPLAGVEYYSANARGVTDENGQFDYLWGDTISFGIDTFEFGTVKGNKLSFTLGDVTTNNLVQDNIQSLVERYATDHDSYYEFSDLVKETFALYPNNINAIINLDLPNGGALEGTNFTIPDEFEAQFEDGLAADLDAVLKQTRFESKDSPSSYSSAGDTGYVTASLNAIFTNVNTFHVFHDGKSNMYSDSGIARGMRALNLSNRAFPVMMPRTDKNAQIPFGEKQKWTHDGKPYLAAHPSLPVQAVPLVTSDTATYGMPFVTTGEIGQGRIVVMGNVFYSSILSCPDNYWVTEPKELAISEPSKTCTTNVAANDPRTDNGDMKRYFANLFEWLEIPKGSKVATNISTGYRYVARYSSGGAYPFFLSDEFGFGDLVHFEKDQFSVLSASETPLLIVRGYNPTVVPDNYTRAFVADLNQPQLSVDDVTAIIRYINDGGHVLFIDAVVGNNPEPIGRLADAAGIALSTHNVAPIYQGNCKDSWYCQRPYPNVHMQLGRDIVTLEQVTALPDGTPAYTVNQDGSVSWSPDAAPLMIPTYQIDLGNGPVTKYARIPVTNETEKAAAIAELQTAFPWAEVCTNEYAYEFNCIEFRPGTGIRDNGTYARQDFDRYSVDVSSMIKAANLGDNIAKLAEHEVYYRTKGKEGTRLSSSDFNQAYDNLSTWLLNDNQYKYDSSVQDELGFETLVNYLNCYTDNKHGGGTSCPEALRDKLERHGMIHDASKGDIAGHMNPSYPLNYMEKPLTRIMLGRSFWDYDITVDTSAYPTRTSDAGTNASVDIVTGGRKVHMSAGNMQSTGLWAKQLENVTVTGGVPATIRVMLADNLTGRPKHETGLKRPPRMEKAFAYDGSSLSFKVPYGGLIYIQPKGTVDGNIATFNFSNVVKAPFYKNGSWVTTPQQSSVGIGEVDTGHIIYTTPATNFQAQDIEVFVEGMNRFANATSDFYGRDEVTETGAHRRFTYDDLDGYRHRFVNDVQISIGAAHSGYPVMSSTYKPASSTIPTNAVNNWLLWHEIGHNVAAVPFNVPGSTEVTNNLLGLYMQELDGRNSNPQMDRIASDIKKMSTWLPDNAGHAWADGGAGLQLVMFGQLKIWAETHFDIATWYSEGDVKPTIYNADQGWNMFKLMHRKARGDVIGDNGGINYCNSKETGLAGGDALMVCASYVSGYDLSDFFSTWNPGETATADPLGNKIYEGGISSLGLSMVASLELSKPEQKPASISSLPN